MDELLVVSFSRESTRELRERVRERLVSARDGLADPAPSTPTTTGSSATSPTADATRSPYGGVGSRRHSPSSTPRRSPRRTASASRCCSRSARRATTTPARCWSRTSATSWPRWPTTSTCASGGRQDAGPPDLARDDVPRARATAAARTRPPSCCPTRRPTARPAMRARIADRGARRGRPTQAAAAAHRLRRHADPARRHAHRPRAPGPVARRGCATATGSCSSTSSRTPTRCSGRSCATAFHGHRTLVLIGDPKQAIYGFRGADVHAYLEADAVGDASCARCRRTGAATPPLLDGLDAVFGGAALGDAADPRACRSPPRTPAGWSTRAAPVRLRVLPRDGADDPAATAPCETGRRRGRGRRRPRRRGRRAARPAARRCAARRPARAPVLPGDIAVLVRDQHGRPQLVQSCLRAAGVPVVLTGKIERLRRPRPPRSGSCCSRRWSSRTGRRGYAVLPLPVSSGSTRPSSTHGGDAYADDLALRLRAVGQGLRGPRCGRAVRDGVAEPSQCSSACSASPTASGC